MIGMSLVGAERIGALELRVEDDVKRGARWVNVQADLQREHSRNTAAQRLELGFYSTCIGQLIGFFRALLQLPHDDVLDHDEPISQSGAAAFSRKHSPAGSVQQPDEARSAGRHALRKRSPPTRPHRWART